MSGLRRDELYAGPAGPANHRDSNTALSHYRTLAGRLQDPYSSHMSPVRARVQKGRLVLDEPTTLPEGTVVDLVADDEGDDLTDEERRALHEALSASWKSAEAGQIGRASCRERV